MTVFESKHPVDLCGPRASKESILRQLERLTRLKCDDDKLWNVIELIEGMPRYACDKILKFKNSARCLHALEHNSRQ